MLRSLIIDDEMSARDIMAYLLKRYCPALEIVGTAEGVRAARKLIKQTRPDVVFLDINMKDGSGFELLDSLDQIDFKVVFVSAYDEYPPKTNAYNALDYLVKPVDKDDLIRAMARIESSPPSQSS